MGFFKKNVKALKTKIGKFLKSLSYQNNLFKEEITFTADLLFCKEPETLKCSLFIGSLVDSHC